MTVIPGRRPDPQEQINDALDRIGILERSGSVSTGTGWRFNVTNIEPGGGYGYVVFDAELDADTMPVPDAAYSPRDQWSAIFADRLGSGILIVSEDIANDQAAEVWVTPDDATLTVFEGSVVGVSRNLGGGVAGAYAFLRTGHVFQVKNALGAAIFQVDEDGTVHTKAGAEMVADL